MSPLLSYTLSPSAEHIEDHVSLMEKIRIASIAEEKIDYVFSLKREPSIRYVLLQAKLIVRAACEIHAHYAAVQNHPKLEDEDDWDSDSDEDSEDKEEELGALEMRKQTNKTHSSETTLETNPFNDPPIPEIVPHVYDSTATLTNLHASSSYRTMSACNNGNCVTSHQLLVMV